MYLLIKRPFQIMIVVFISGLLIQLNYLIVICLVDYFVWEIFYFSHFKKRKSLFFNIKWCKGIFCCYGNLIDWSLIIVWKIFFMPLKKREKDRY